MIKNQNKLMNKSNFDAETSIASLKEVVKKFCELRDWDQYHDPKELSIAIITEASELLEIFRFKTKEDMEQMFQDSEKRMKIADELSDVLYFLLRFSQKYNFDLANEFNRKMVENEMKYPIDLFKGSNRKYSEDSK